MSFTSTEYLLFLPLMFLACQILPHRLQNLFLLGASWAFYGWVHPWFLYLILGVTAMNWGAALAIEQRPQHRRLWLALGVTVSLGVLAVFKYLGFFVASLQSVLEGLGVESSLPTLRIFLPVGISFYVFQGAGYLIDVSRERLKARRSFADLALFIAFFPQLVAGPIERASNLLPQIETPRRFSADLAREGLVLLVWGFFKKMVIADNVGLLANKIFALEAPGFSLLWAGVFAFAVQILADFSGYTDIARGSAALLGFRLMRNFHRPYFATSIADFWRRWHMSLSQWLRDYLYIPLGGSRVSLGRGLVNVMITFLLCGLWHGASWNFVLWGGYHGFLITVERLWARFVPTIPGATLRRPLRMAATFLLVCLGWLLFRETDLDRLTDHLALRPGNEDAAAIGVAWYAFVLSALYAIPLIIHGLFEHQRERAAAPGRRARTLESARVLLAGLLFLATLLFRCPDPSSFLYFQF
ncbi:MAG: MBOAT family protein [Planctomycetes bacterium]|nr:MBOAT family protein [Planctomycetota bacterium]